MVAVIGFVSLMTLVRCRKKCSKVLVMQSRRVGVYIWNKETYTNKRLGGLGSPQAGNVEGQVAREQRSVL